MLGPAIVVRDAAVAPPGFDARRSALARRYRYTVLNRPVPDPFLAATTWHVDEPLDLAALRLSCDPVIGEHDFSAFCRAPRRDPDASLVRRVDDARWLDLGDGVLRFDIDAGSFCQQMVRALVGTMVPMGLGRRRAGEMASILRSRRRAEAGRVAPARGLCLWEVVYPDPAA
jgi:tRNA pseudouridine38-40 synthase